MTLRGWLPFCRILVFQSHDLEDGIGPGIANQIGCIFAAGRNIHLIGYQRFVEEAAAGGRSDYQDRKLPDHRNIAGIGDIELIGTGHGLLVGGDLLETYVAEDGIVAVKHHIVAGAAVRHVGNAVTAGVKTHVVAAGAGHLNHVEAALGSIHQNHSVVFAGREWESLLEQNRPQAGSAANCNRMETIRNRVIIGDCTKPGVNGIVCIINRNIYSKAVGGGV